MKRFLGVARHALDPRLRRRWTALLGTAALAPLPLVGTLGYESSLVLSPLFGILGVGIGVDAVRAERSTSLAAGSTRLVRLAKFGARELALLGAIALAVLLSSQLWQRNCDPWGGLLFFAMGPLFSGALGWLSGIWGGVLGSSRSRQMVLGLLPLLLATGIGLWRLYFDPVVFAFDPFWGYFSGSVYDEDVAVDTRYLVYRAYNLVVAAAGALIWHAVVDPALLELRSRASNRPRMFSAGLGAVLAVTAGAIAWRADHHGFTASFGSITTVLSASHRTEHFVIHFVPRSPTAREIEAVAAEHEFAWHRLHRLLGRAPSGPIHSFVFTSPQQKRALMGAGRVEVAPPWRRHLYLNHQPFPHPVLHHELAHAFESAIGDPIFGLSLGDGGVNLALVEGLATAVAPRVQDGLDIHDQAAILDRLGLRPSLAAIMGAGFWASASRHAYTASGSFTRWLMERHDVEQVVELYESGGDFDAAYGRALSALESEWVDFLRSRAVADDVVAAHEQRFRVRPVFHRPCAHRVAKLIEAAQIADVRGDADAGLAAYRKLCALEPERVEHRLSLAETLARQSRFAEARAVLDEAEHDERLTATMASIIDERRGDIALHLRELGTASAAYQSALDLPIDEDRRRVLSLKLLGAHDRELAPMISGYFRAYDDRGDDFARAIERVYTATRIRNVPGYRGLGNYLLALQLLNVQDYEHAVDLLERSLADRDGFPGAEFVRSARLRLIAAYAVTGRYDRAFSTLRELQEEASPTSGETEELSLWADRLDFLAAYVPAG